MKTIVSVIIVTRVVETKPIVPKSIVTWIPAVIAEELVFRVSVHEPASVEAVHRTHPKWTTIEVTA